MDGVEILKSLEDGLVLMDMTKKSSVGVLFPLELRKAIEGARLNAVRETPFF